MSLHLLRTVIFTLPRQITVQYSAKILALKNKQKYENYSDNLKIIIIISSNQKSWTPETNSTQSN